MKKFLKDSAVAFGGGFIAGTSERCAEVAGNALWNKAKTTKYGKKVNNFFK